MTIMDTTSLSSPLAVPTLQPHNVRHLLAVPREPLIRAVGASRLSKVFARVPHIPFDDSSRLIFMSDIHRGVNGRTDAFVSNQHLYCHALSHYEEQGFTYVQVGDGDELWQNRRFHDIRRAHSASFDILTRFHKADRLHLIWGNHDMHWRSEANVRRDLHHYHDEEGRIKPLFQGIQVNEGLLLCHKQLPYRIFVVHGHQIDVISDRLWRVSQFVVRYIWKRLRQLGVKNINTPDKAWLEKQLISWAKTHGQVMICGHTHRASFATEDPPLYFNTGSCVHPGHITCIEVHKGKIMLVKWSARPKAGYGGGTHISRELLASPAPLKALAGI